MLAMSTTPATEYSTLPCRDRATVFTKLEQEVIRCRRLSARLLRAVSLAANPLISSP